MRAQVVPYSSVVGSSIMILNDQGIVQAQLAVIVQQNHPDHKAASTGIAVLIADALNAYGKSPELTDYSISRASDPGSYVYAEGGKVVARAKAFSAQEAIAIGEEVCPDATVCYIIGKQKHDTIVAPLNGIEQQYVNLKLPERNRT